MDSLELDIVKVCHNNLSCLMILLVMKQIFPDLDYQKIIDRMPYINIWKEFRDLGGILFKEYPSKENISFYMKQTRVISKLKENFFT